MNYQDILIEIARLEKENRKFAGSRPVIISSDGLKKREFLSTDRTISSWDVWRYAHQAHLRTVGDKDRHTLRTSFFRGI